MEVQESWVFGLFVLVGEFTCLSSLLFAFHDRSRIFATDWFNEFYGGGKLVEL
jgi:hypothetical protein